MTTESAIKLLSKKISSGKNFYPVVWDKKAMNAIIEYHNNENTKAERYRANFIKLYTMCFKIFLSRNKCLKTGQKAMHTIIDKPLDDIIDDFRCRLNDVEKFEWMKSKGFCSDLPSLISDEDKAKNMALAEDNFDEFLDYTEGLWDFDTVKHHIITQAQIALNRF